MNKKYMLIIYQKDELGYYASEFEPSDFKIIENLSLSEAAEYYSQIDDIDWREYTIVIKEQSNSVNEDLWNKELEIIKQRKLEKEKAKLQKLKEEINEKAKNKLEEIKLNPPDNKEIEKNISITTLGAVIATYILYKDQNNE